MKKNVIEVKNVSKSFRIPHEKISTMRGAFVNVFKKNTYEEFKALDNISFEVKKGEFFGIIGRNGSGKSTLLKILAGIYSQDRGKVKIDGLISPFLELGIGFNPELSGKDNIYLNGTVLGLTKNQVDKRFDDIVRFSELKRFIDQKVKNYSSGMQVRLAFSVAIHANRDILLMDEVLAVGDANFQRKCLDVFKKLKREGKTIIFVSHDLESVKDFCDRVMLLDKSKIKTIAGAEKAIYEYAQLLMRETDKVKEEEKKPVKEKFRKSKGKNRILGARIYNKKGKETALFEREEDVIVEIDLDIQRVDKDIFLNLGIFDKETNSLVSGSNMYYEKRYEEWKKGKNSFRLIFPSSILNKGDFYIASALFRGDPKDNHVYDMYNQKELDKYFRVIPTDRHNGLVHLEHKWERVNKK